MDATEALKIIRPLSEGVDPYTGEIYPQNSPYQNPETVRALYSAVSALEKMARREMRKNGSAKRAGEEWTEKEKKSVFEFYASGITVDKIAEKVQRTPYAVAYYLFRNKKMPESELLKYGAIKARRDESGQGIRQKGKF
jgi:hypothetical protein